MSREGPKDLMNGDADFSWARLRVAVKLHDDVMLPEKSADLRDLAAAPQHGVLRAGGGQGPLDLIVEIRGEPEPMTLQVLREQLMYGRDPHVFEGLKDLQGRARQVLFHEIEDNLEARP
jgi:hypothetical protein